MPKLQRWFTCLIGIIALGSATHTYAALPSIKSKTYGMVVMPGLVNLYWDESKGDLYLQIDKLEEEFIYQVSLASGLGSNPVSLDRGQLGHTFIIEAKKVGPKIFFLENNYKFRANSDNPAERKAVKEAFAPSVQWGFDIVASSGGSYLVKATDYFLRDTHGVIGSLKRAKQGKFKLDKKRSSFHLERTKAFPKNTEVETSLTFASNEPGELVNAVAANGGSITLRQHHTFMEAPTGYQTREDDSRIGSLGITYQDYGTAIEEDLFVRLAGRHRLLKKDPLAEKSEAVEPIVYYLDSGTPEPIRSALIEGAMWWNEAFEAAGFIDAFQMKILPEGADPQDSRYNMIHWTHRRSRGYSYGSFIMDPRTAEIIKGNVNLGSLRLRQDYLHGRKVLGSAPQANSGQLCQLSEAPNFDYLAKIANGNDKAAVAMALARVRQLSAHEVGHTLGLPHNFMASSYGRESVMDYPAPLIKIDNGKIDLSDAYAVGIGEYDKLSIRWLYGEFPKATEQQELDKIVRESIDRGLIFMDHSNNKFTKAANPKASVWDNGSDLVKHLEHEYKVRRIALDNFGPQLLRQGEAMSNLERLLLPIYMHHRFQLNAAAQTLGGADYRNAYRGDGQMTVQIVAGKDQLHALNVILQSLEPEFLRLPEAALNKIPPPAARQNQGEVFAGRTNLVFDDRAVIEASAALSIDQLLRPQRMERLLSFESRGDYPSLTLVIERLIATSWGRSKAEDQTERDIEAIVQQLVVSKLAGAAANKETSTAARAIINKQLLQLAKRITKNRKATALQQQAARDIGRWLKDQKPSFTTIVLPAGDPI